MINLLSQEIKTERKKNATFAKLLVFFLAILLLVVGNYLTIYFLQNSLVAKNASLTDEKTDIDLKNAKYRDLEKDIAFVNGRLDLIKTTVENRPKWSSIIAGFSSLVPTSVQVSNLSISGSAADKTKGMAYTVTMTGVAKTLEDIEVFRKTLDDSGSFTNSIFKSASFNADQSNFSFGLSTSVVLKTVGSK